MKYLKTHEDYTKFRDTKKSLKDTIDKAKRDIVSLDRDLNDEIIKKFKSFKLDRVEIKYHDGLVFLYFRDGKYFSVEDKYSVNILSDYLFENKLKILEALEKLTPEEIEDMLIKQESGKFNF